LEVVGQAVSLACANHPVADIGIDGESDCRVPVTLGGGPNHLRARLYQLRRLLLVGATAVLLMACEREVESVAQEARPVRTMTVDKRDGGAHVVLTGRIEAEDEVALALRISGRVVENNMKLGDRVRPGQIVARLEPHNELNAMRTAQASLASAKALFVRARNHFARQETLVRQGWATKKAYDAAKQELQAAQSQVETAEAQLKVAQDLPTLYVAWFRGREAPSKSGGHEELCLASKAPGAR